MPRRRALSSWAPSRNSFDSIPDAGRLVCARFLGGVSATRGQINRTTRDLPGALPSMALFAVRLPRASTCSASVGDRPGIACLRWRPCPSTLLAVGSLFGGPRALARLTVGGPKMSRPVCSHVSASSRPAKGLPILAAVGSFGYGVEVSLFFSALNHGSAAAVTLLFYTYPVYTMVIALLTKRLPHRPSLLLGLARDRPWRASSSWSPAAESISISRPLGVALALCCRLSLSPLYLIGHRPGASVASNPLTAGDLAVGEVHPPSASLAFAS